MFYTFYELFYELENGIKDTYNDYDIDNFDELYKEMEFLQNTKNINGIKINKLSIVKFLANVEDDEIIHYSTVIERDIIK